MSINLTQWAGLAAFAPAALLAAAAFGATRRGRFGWAIVALLHAAMALEVLAMTRHGANAALGGWLRAAGLYPDRRPAQLLLVVVAVGLGVLAIRFVTRRAPSRALAIAQGATTALVFLFAVESISLHAVDAVLYRMVGPVKLIGWLWLAAGATTALAAMRVVRR